MTLVTRRGCGTVEPVAAIDYSHDVTVETARRHGGAVLFIRQ